VLKTKILIITHRNFTKLIQEVIETLTLPVEITIHEVGFGEINKLIDLKEIYSFDIIITSGAHWELIKKEFHELTYRVPIYPFRFTQADVVKSLVHAKALSNKILLMYYGDEEYELEKYRDILGVDVVRPFFKDIQEAEKLIIEYREKGYNAVIGTSSICELAQKHGCYPVLVYSFDSMKIEFMKAYQLAVTKNRVKQYAALKEVLFDNLYFPIFLSDNIGTIMDVNTAGVTYASKRSKYELIGTNINSVLNVPVSVEKILEDEDLKPIINVHNKITEKTIPIYLNSKLDGFVTVIDYHGVSTKQNHVKMSAKYDFNGIVANSPAMKKVIVKAQQYALSDAPILICGESGTGKELLAHSIHNFSHRKYAPFVPVNCAAIPQNILESELFGYEEGAFTGAMKGGKPGFFEMAQGGTIFLDEIGEIPLETQTKLLRVLQEKEIIRLGGRQIIPLNVRIITATNQSLSDLVKMGKFREDLYFRISVLQINIPPLRERKEDIIPLLKHLFLKHGTHPEYIEYFIRIGENNILSYDWPGNIRELENFVQKLNALTSNNTLTYDLKSCFRDVMSEHFDYYHKPNVHKMTVEQDIPQPVILKDIERARIIDCLLYNKGNKTKTAKQLGISRATLWRKMKEYNIK
jgi:propionate catabolism operon transcriptional regulator